MPRLDCRVIRALGDISNIFWHGNRWCWNSVVGFVEKIMTKMTMECIIQMVEANVGEKD